MSREKEVLLSVKHLKKYFNVGRGSVLKAVDDVSFDIYKGETLGMVGESGCGKTTCGRTAMGLYPKTDGQVLFDRKDVHALRGAAKQEFTRRAQIIFQDPYASLNPRMTVADIIAEGIDIHGLTRSRAERTERVYDLLNMVGLNKEHANRFAHEFSGGQRQRIGIARALALDGAEYLAEQVQEDGSILLPGGEERLSAAEHADVLSAIIQGYRLLPSETLAKGIDRAAGWLLSQTAYTEDDVAYLPDHGEITLESSALALIALADCAETSGNTGYIPACEALGAGILSLLDTGTGSFTHVLDASDLGRKEAVRSAEWDGMGVTALCRLYGLTQDPLWLWAAELVLDRMIEEDPAQYGDVWTACALREVTKYAQDRTDYFVFALKHAQVNMASVYVAQGTDPAGLEMLLVSCETYGAMLDAGYSADGFASELLQEIIAVRAQRQLDGYLFPEYAMYFAEPQKVLGAFMVREDGLNISASGMCRNIGGYSLYAVYCDKLAAEKPSEYEGA